LLYFVLMLLAFSNVHSLLLILTGCHQETFEGLHERTEHLDISFFCPSLNGVLFPMFFLLVERDCQILVF